MEIREHSSTDVPRHRQQHYLTTLDRRRPDDWIREPCVDASSAPHDGSTQQAADDNNSSPTTTNLKSVVYEHGIKHFLPAQYPQSVTPGYGSYALYGFGASVAGSAAMVLSTQTLLLAVGVVGAGTAGQASVMAGALNWVLKDGAGQLGGVLYASFLGRTRRFDANPKRWRMVAALSLDLGTLLEILSPYAAKSSGLVLPLACLANVLKNIGFLTASASRASLHQAMAIRGNLGDVTAKSGSQATAAGLCGTTLGISLSSILSSSDNSVETFVIAFCALSLLHQVGNYLSVGAVPLSHFNHQRMHILMEDYCQQIMKTNPQELSDTAEVLTPQDVASKENFLPWVSDTHTGILHDWLAVGSPLDHLARSGTELQQLIDMFSLEAYLLSQHDDGYVYLTFQSVARGEDFVRGMLHAYILKGMSVTQSSKNALSDSLSIMQREAPSLIEDLQAKGWRLGTESFIIEPPGAIRYNYQWS